MNLPTHRIETPLSAEFHLRPAQWRDLPSVAQLMLAVCTADGDPLGSLSIQDLEREWKTPGFELETHAWVVEAPDGKIVGYEEFINQHAHALLRGDGYVQPELRGRGIGTALLRTLEGRARLELEQAAPDLRVCLRNGTMIADTAGRELHEQEGYRLIRYAWRMEITLSAAPDAAVFPQGIELRAFQKGVHDQAVWQADNESFRDHWGSAPQALEPWLFRKLGSPDFDPTLWHIAWDGDEIAGFSQCRYRRDMGWVGTLGVRRPWRHKGLGLALLQHSFQEFYRRGTHTVGLGVDAQNPTGATRLYKKAGMQVTSEFVLFEKELRPGREPQES